MEDGVNKRLIIVTGSLVFVFVLPDIGMTTQGMSAGHTIWLPCRNICIEPWITVICTVLWTLVRDCTYTLTAGESPVTSSARTAK